MSDEVKPIDTLDFDANFNITGEPVDTNTNTYSFTDTLGHCWDRSVTAGQRSGCFLHRRQGLQGRRESLEIGPAIQALRLRRVRIAVLPLVGMEKPRELCEAFCCAKDRGSRVSLSRKQA